MHLRLTEECCYEAKTKPRISRYRLQAFPPRQGIGAEWSWEAKRVREGFTYAIGMQASSVIDKVGLGMFKCFQTPARRVNSTQY